MDIIKYLVGWTQDLGLTLLSGLGMAVTSWLTAGFAAQWLDCRLTRKRFFPGKAAAALAPALLLYGSMLTIFAVVTFAGGREWNLKLGLTVAGGLTAYHLWTGSVVPRILRRLTDDPPPWIVEAVQAATPHGSTTPPVRILRSDSVNALAMLRHGWIAFTRGAVEHLTPQEVTCIARHEVAHLSEPVREVRRRQRGVLALVPPLLIAPLVETFGFSMGMVFAFAGSWIIGVALSGHSQRMEKRADAAGAGEDPATYARTLERIHELNFMPVVIAMPGQTHPDLYDRMLAAGVQPAYPRPAPPKWMAARVARVMGFITMLLAGIIWALLLNVHKW